MFILGNFQQTYFILLMLLFNTIWQLKKQPIPDQNLKTVLDLKLKF